jgi:hypothetical protein
VGGGTVVHSKLRELSVKSVGGGRSCDVIVTGGNLDVLHREACSARGKIPSV